MTNDLAQTPLHDWHAAHGGRMVDFAGWSMPVQYSSIVEEHTATRTAVGLFDISHMGRLYFSGDGAGRFLDRLLTRRVLGMSEGKIRYSLMANHRGGILDDVLVYCLSDFHLLVVNAGNREKIVAWVAENLSDEDDVAFDDRTRETAMLAVQGPRALQIAQPMVSATLADMPYYFGQPATIGGAQGIVSRTGYTGEDGCELIVPAESAAALWDGLLEAAAAAGGRPAGLGARDTLRLEAAMPLYGHELSESINPFQAGLGFAVNLADRRFVGRDALTDLKKRDDLPVRIGVEMMGRRVPREHYEIYAKDDPVGNVTSGTFSPTLKRPIAMGFVPPEAATEGTQLAIDIRGQRESATVVKMPFYSRTT